MNPVTKALAVTILFSAVGCWALLFRDVAWDSALPHAIFYAVLTLNTYFSVRFYSRFTPASFFQSGIDCALVTAYIGLALSIGLPTSFALFALAVFAIAPAKYIHLLGKTPYDATLRRKIRIDLLGTSLCVAVVSLTLAGFAVSAAWILSGLFTVANIYLLMINPMYRHVEAI